MKEGKRLKGEMAKRDKGKPLVFFSLFPFSPFNLSPSAFPSACDFAL